MIVSTISTRMLRVEVPYLRDQRLLGAWLGVVTILALPDFRRRDGCSTNGERSETESNLHIDKSALSRVFEMVEASCGVSPP